MPEALARQSFTVTVGAVNAPTVITGEPHSQIGVGQTYCYAIRATDVDSDPLTGTLSAGPAGMRIDPTTERIQWPPLADQQGMQSVTVRVEDGRGGQPFELRPRAHVTRVSPDALPVRARQR